MASTVFCHIFLFFKKLGVPTLIINRHLSLHFIEAAFLKGFPRYFFRSFMLTLMYADSQWKPRRFPLRRGFHMKTTDTPVLAAGALGVLFFAHLHGRGLVLPIPHSVLILKAGTSVRRAQQFDSVQDSMEGSMMPWWHFNWQTTVSWTLKSQIVDPVVELSKHQITSYISYIRFCCWMPASFIPDWVAIVLSWVQLGFMLQSI